MEKEEQKNQGMEILTNKKVQLFITLAGVAVALLNIWVASVLAPIASDIAVVTQRVDAVELDVIPRGEVEARLDDISNRLNRIENKIDNHFQN